MDFTREEIEGAELILVVDSAGGYRWSSHRTSEQVALMLARVADEVRRQSKREMAEAIERGDWDAEG